MQSVAMFLVGMLLTWTPPRNHLGERAIRVVGTVSSCKKGRVHLASRWESEHPYFNNVILLVATNCPVWSL